MDIKPLTDNCARALTRGDAAVLGISPFNSYFSESRIATLAEWAYERFNAVYYYVPDGPSVHTLEALGYTPAKAARKARRQAAWLCNKIRRADALAGGVSACERILDSRLLDRDPIYQDLLHRVHERHREDAMFQEACQDCSGWVLQNYLESPGKQAVDGAVRYLLAEIPLFVGACEIIQSRSAVFLYHQCPSFVEGLYRGEHGALVADNQGFVVARPQAVDMMEPLGGSENHDPKQRLAAS